VPAQSIEPAGTTEPPIAPEPVLRPRPAPVRVATVPLPAPPVEPAPPEPLLPIWLPPTSRAANEVETVDWPAPPLRVGRYRRRAAEAVAHATNPRVVRRRKPPRRPLVGLLWLVILALLATFFAWFSAEPLWLTLGHGVRGTATVGTCQVGGLRKQCADFASDNGDVVATRVTLLGSGHLKADEKVAARMVSERGWEVYAGDRSGLYLRWVPGFALVILCGLAIAWATGAYRLTGRARTLAVLTSLAGPVLLALGMLAAAW
jgi:multisubunit Na+/H+ antiporter MnhB subunit